MDIKKFEYVKGRIAYSITVPFRNTLLEVAMTQIGASSDEVIILELGSIAPKELRKDTQGKKQLPKLMKLLESTAQSLADKGVVIDGVQYHLLQATSSAKTSASMLLSSNTRLVAYFNSLMTHPKKTANQLRMGYQLPLTPNKSLVTGKLKVLIVDDEFDGYRIDGGSISQCIGIDDNGAPMFEMISTWDDAVISHFDTRKAIAGVGDCHMKVSAGFAQYLTDKGFLDTVNQGCQFRLLVHDVPAMAKGTFVVSSEVPDGYHAVIPKSAFKLGLGNLPYLDGTYTITLGATMPAVKGVSRFGSQFCRSMGEAVLEARKPIIARHMARLNEAGNSIEAAAKYFKAEKMQNVIFVNEETGEQEERDDWFYKAMVSIADEPERLGWALKDPTIIMRTLSSIAKKKTKLALGMGFIGRVRTALPDDNLPLHVIASNDAPRIERRDGKWIDSANGKVYPDNAVGMVRVGDTHYIGLLVIRAKAPIMNHAEQALAVLVYQDREGDGCEYMSHQSASICTMDFDGDRNSSLVYQREDGYIEAINWMVKLQRDYPIQPVTKEKSKVDRGWGELTRLVYESAFEKGCSAITSMYSVALSGGLESLAAWLVDIAELTAATQLWLDVQKYAPEDPSACEDIIDSAMQYYQSWQGDQRGWEYDSIPFIHRQMRTSKVDRETGKPIKDAGIVAECIRHVNLLHEAPRLLDEMSPMSHLKGIWGNYSDADLSVAHGLRESMRQLKELSEEEGLKRIGALFDHARELSKEWTQPQFSAFWDMWYHHERLVAVSKDGSKYLPTGGTVWAIFCDRILGSNPELLLKKERVFFKGKVDCSEKIIHRLTQGSYTSVIEVGEVIEGFAEKNGVIQYHPVLSVKTGTVIGYIGTNVPSGRYEIEAFAIYGKSGNAYPSCFDIQIKAKLA